MVQRTTDRSRVALGRWGERRAARHYEAAGYVVLDQNWHVRGGELDLVMMRGDEIVFCEVKTRSSNRFGSGLEAVDERKCDETATRLGELPEPIGNPNALDRVSDRTWVGMGGESACRFVEQGRSLIGLALSGDGHEDVAGERRSIRIVEKPTTEGENR